VQFVLSYDGSCGDRTYGDALPKSLHMKRVLVDAGRSSQATLNGREDRTVESIYISAGLAVNVSIPKMVRPEFVSEQVALFDQG
jgi:DNA adenine methylase